MANEIRRRVSRLAAKLQEFQLGAIEFEEQIAAIQRYCPHANKKKIPDPIPGWCLWICQDCRKSWEEEQP